MANPTNPNFGAPNPAGLSTIEGLGHIGLALYHLFSGGDDREESEVEEPSRRPRHRFTSPVSARAGKSGSCCRAKRPLK